MAKMQNKLAIGPLWVLMFYPIFGCSDPQKSSESDPHLRVMQVATTPQGSVRVGGVEAVYRTNHFSVDWFASTNLILRQPRWDGYSNPIPLNPSEASRSALNEVKKFIPEVAEWRVESIYLRNLATRDDTSDIYSEIWYYQVSLLPSLRQLQERTEAAFGHRLTQVILLDGTLLPPTIQLQHITQN
jgi:hypothetical protein